MIEEDLILKLYDIESIKFDTFTLKSGLLSPIYLDLRVVVSYPRVLEMIAQLMWKKINRLHFDLLCGVPYTALPIATAISLMSGKPMVMRRKEAKVYGTKRTIEGQFQPSQTCLVIEDLVTSSSSIFETINALEIEQLQVSDAAVLVDREQGGRRHLKENGINLHSVFTLTRILEVLLAKKKIDMKTFEKVMDFISKNQTPHPLSLTT